MPESDLGKVLYILFMVFFLSYTLYSMREVSRLNEDTKKLMLKAQELRRQRAELEKQRSEIGTNT